MADVGTTLDHGSVGATVTTISVVFGCITIVVMLLRLFTRFYIIKTVGPDDVLMIFAALLSWAFIIATVLAVQHGLGSHIGDVMERGQANLTSYAQIVWFSSIFYNACLGFIKCSVLALYTRLGDRALRRMALIMITIVACSATANVLVCIFQCDPIPAAWDTAITKKVCININAFYLANAATNILTDVLTYTLPIPLVLKLQVPQNQKIALGVMLSLGLFACVSSIIRITFIPRMLKDPDVTFAISGAMYWSAIETNVGILAASIPSFKALVKRYMPRFLGEYSSGGHRRGASSGLAGRSGSQGPFRKMGSSTTNGDVKLGSMTRSLKGDDSTVVSVRDVDSTDKGSSKYDYKGGQKGLTTMIEQDSSPNSSEERLTVPEGRIMARTQVTTHVSEQGSLDDEETGAMPRGGARRAGRRDSWLGVGH